MVKKKLTREIEQMLVKQNKMRTSTLARKEGRKREGRKERKEGRKLWKKRELRLDSGDSI